MILKKNCKLIGLRPEMMVALLVARDVYAGFKKELVLTSVNDGVHSKTSLHYSGCGIDLRTRYFDTQATKEKVARLIRERLTDDFDVLLEKDHLHLEFQPRG